MLPFFKKKKYVKADLPHFPFMCQLLDTAAALSVSFPSYHQSDIWVIIILGAKMTMTIIFTNYKFSIYIIRQKHMGHRNFKGDGEDHNQYIKHYIVFMIFLMQSRTDFLMDVYNFGL